jgi:hypothetical protein
VSVPPPVTDTTRAEALRDAIVAYAVERLDEPPLVERLTRAGFPQGILARSSLADLAIVALSSAITALAARADEVVAVRGAELARRLGERLADVAVGIIEDARAVSPPVSRG